MSNLNATELAAKLDASKARISQYVSEGKLEGCYTGEGRSRRFDIEKVSTALGRRLDPGQMMGNGSETRKALRNIEAGEAPPPRMQKTDGPLPPNDPDRYELARILNAEEDARRKRRDNERDEGCWVLAEEVARHTARTMAQEVAQFETALRDGARAVADNLAVVLNNAIRQYPDPEGFCRALTDKYLSMDECDRTALALAMITEIAAREALKRMHRESDQFGNAQ